MTDKELLELLREVEWVVDDTDRFYCPICSGERPMKIAPYYGAPAEEWQQRGGHESGCRMAAALAYLQSKVE